MADQVKYTKGEWVREGRTVYALEVDKDRRGREYLRNRFAAGFSGGPDTPESEVEANAQLATAAPDLLEALREFAAEAWDPDASATDYYERVAEEFRRATGFLRPGKDEAAGGFGHSEKDRRAAWDKWVEDRARARVAKARAAIARATHPAPETP